MRVRSFVVTALGVALLAGATACAPPVGDPCEAFDACPAPAVQFSSDLQSQ